MAKRSKNVRRARGRTRRGCRARQRNGARVRSAKRVHVSRIPSEPTRWWGEVILITDPKTGEVVAVESKPHSAQFFARVQALDSARRWTRLLATATALLAIAGLLAAWGGSYWPRLTVPHPAAAGQQQLADAFDPAD